MTLRELLKKHPDLSSNHGDPVFRRSVWAPFFQSLHENKVIYRERFVCLARLDDLETDERGVRGTVVPLRYLHVPHYILVPSDSWRFGGSWEYMCQGADCLSQPYASWSVWPEAKRVEAIEKLLSKEDVEGAMELIN